MSTNLYWEPVVERKHKSFGGSLKSLLREHRGLDYEGIVMAQEDCAWLNGVMAGTTNEDLRKDIRELLEAIEKYTQVKLWRDE